LIPRLAEATAGTDPSALIRWAAAATSPAAKQNSFNAIADFAVRAGIPLERYLGANALTEADKQLFQSTYQAAQAKRGKTP
jgi:hypothetical protein